MEQISTMNYREQRLKQETEGKILKYINLIRQKPREFIEILEDYKLDFEDNTYTYKKYNKKVQTREGTTVIHEAIKQLNERHPILPLEIEHKLNITSQSHLDYLTEQSSISHLGKNSQNSQQRIETIMGKGSSAECIFIQEPKAKHLVINLFLDDGLFLRPNRRVLLSKDLKSFGMAISSHPKEKWVSVLQFHGPPEAKFNYKFPENALDEEPWPEECNYLEKTLYRTYGDQEVYTKFKYDYEWPDVEGSERYQRVEEVKEKPVKFKN